MQFPKRQLQVILMIGLSALSAAAAQNSETSSFGEYLEIELVTVELFVTDTKGRPLGDLSAEEVTVFEDNREVPLTHFQAPAPSALATHALRESGRDRHELPEVTATGDPIRLVVFVDNLNSGPASRSRLLTQVWDVMGTTLRASDEVMVASFDGSLAIQMPFSRDRKKLRQTLEQVATLSGDRLIPSLRDRNALELIQLDQDFNADGPCVYVGMLARQHSDDVHHQVQRTLSALEQFISSLAGVPGRKMLLHVSDGIPLIPGAEAWNHAIALCDGSGSVEGVPGAAVADQMDGTPNRFDPKTAVLDMLSYDTTEQWRRLAGVANAHRVVIYPFYAPGLQAPTRSNVDSVTSTVRNETAAITNYQDTLSILADETGGAAQFSTNDFRPAVRDAIDESLSSYELAYLSPTPGDGRLHSIRVKVDRPGVRLRYRKSYQSKDVHQRVEEGVLSALFYDLGVNPLGIRVDTVPVGSRVVDGKREVKIHISVPLEGLTLLPQEGHHSGLFTVFIAVRKPNGETTPVGRRQIPVTVTDEEFPLTGESFEYVVGMTVDTEPTTISVGLRDDMGGETSYVTSRIDSRL